MGVTRGGAVAFFPWTFFSSSYFPEVAAAQRLYNLFYFFSEEFVVAVQAVLLRLCLCATVPQLSSLPVEFCANAIISLGEYSFL